MKTKLLLAALMLSMSLSLFAQSGTCGTNLTWNFSGGVLTISGTGDMTDYAYGSTAMGQVSNCGPWMNLSIRTVRISDGVTSIGKCAFYYCRSLTSVTIPNSVTSIGEGAFCDCSSLNSVEIPNSVTSIGNNAFSGCNKITSIVIPNNVTQWDYAFRNCTKLTSIVISNGVTSIGHGAFYGCSSLTSIEIPNNVTSIGQNAFRDCSSLTSVTISNGVTNIGSYAFSGCSSLTSIIIPNSVTIIGEYAFSSCGSLTSVTIGNSVTTIGNYAFQDCSSLSSVTIGNSVTSIGVDAFSGCGGIKTITSYAETPPTAQYLTEAYSSGHYRIKTTKAFGDLDVSDIALFVPEQWIPLYKYDAVWKEFNIKGMDASEAQFTVTWKNYDGSVLETDENVASGTIPAYNGATPVKPADDHYIYTFAGWSPTVVTVTDDATYVATYTATVKEHTYIIHVNQDCTSYMEEQQ